MDAVTLYNLALKHVAGSKIQAVDEGGNASVCNEFIEIAVDNALEPYDFSFARARRELVMRTIVNPDPVAVLTIPTIPETYGDWAYVYDLPNDFLSMREVVDLDNDETEILMTTICTDSDTLTIEYTSSLRIIENFPNPFSTALSYLLAVFIGYPVSGTDPERDMRNMQMYDVFYKKAKEHDSRRKMVSVQGAYTLMEE